MNIFLEPSAPTRNGSLTTTEFSRLIAALGTDMPEIPPELKLLMELQVAHAKQAVELQHSKELYDKLARFKEVEFEAAEAKIALLERRCEDNERKVKTLEDRGLWVMNWKRLGQLSLLVGYLTAVGAVISWVLYLAGKRILH
jgi:hypothetical protein